MDEILIEEKKYISSKQAAKVTGYAKDYIGQLCREGRVPARFVGRSWYVLESAIQDHRFGLDTNLQDMARTAQPVEQQPSQTWESPRYEATQGEILPSVNKLQQVEIETETQAEMPQSVNNVEEVTNNIQESWREWFSNFDNKVTIEPEPIEEIATTSEVEAPIESVGEEEKVEIEIEKDVSIPIHTVYQLPPEELLPHRGRSNKIEEQEEEVPIYKEVAHKRRFTGLIRTVRALGVVVATIMVTLAIAGSGVVDKYLVSLSPVNIIAGVSVYNK